MKESQTCLVVYGDGGMELMHAQHIPAVFGKQCEGSCSIAHALKTAVNDDANSGTAVVWIKLIKISCPYGLHSVDLHYHKP